MSNILFELGMSSVVLEAESPFNRIFGIDFQLFHDSAILALSVFVLFIGMSYLLFNPARELLRKREAKIREEMDLAAKDKEEAAIFKAEYTTKLKEVDKESEVILSETRKRAMKKETEIVNEAKVEATRILERANKEIELEKKKVKDEVKQEMISVASLMAGKIVAASINEKEQEQLIEETLKEMGDGTWQN